MNYGHLFAGRHPQNRSVRREKRYLEKIILDVAKACRQHGWVTGHSVLRSLGWMPENMDFVIWHNVRVLLGRGGEA